MKFIVDTDGVSLDYGDGALRKLDATAVRVNPNGSLTLRIPAREVVVVNPIDHYQTYDMNDVARCLIAVVFCGLPLAKIAAVRPAVAAAIQTFMANNGLTAGDAP